MTKLLHPRTLLMVAALCAACGEPGDEEYDDPTGDPSNMGTWDAGNPGGGGSVDAGRSDAGPPWDSRFDAGGGGGPADAGGVWDAGPSLDAGWSGGSDASADAGSRSDAAPPDAALADASADASRSDAGTPGADASTCTLTYANFGQQFLTTYCISCHGATNPRGNVRLDSLAGVTARKAQAKPAVLNGVMPQGLNRPSDADRQRFAQWLDCGPN